MRFIEVSVKSIALAFIVAAIVFAVDRLYQWIDRRWRSY